MSKFVFRISVAVLLTMMLSFLSVIGSQTTPRAATQGMNDWNRQIVADQLMDRLAGLYNRTMRVCKFGPSLCEKANKEYPVAMSKLAEARRSRNSDQVLVHYSSVMDEIEVALRKAEALVPR